MHQNSIPLLQSQRPAVWVLMLTFAKSTSWLIKTSNSSRIEECAESKAPRRLRKSEFDWTRVQLHDVGLRTNTKLDHRPFNSAYYINHPNKRFTARVSKSIKITTSQWFDDQSTKMGFSYVCLTCLTRISFFFGPRLPFAFGTRSWAKLSSSLHDKLGSVKNTNRKFREDTCSQSKSHEVRCLGKIWKSFLDSSFQVRFAMHWCTHEQTASTFAPTNATYNMSASGWNVRRSNLRDRFGTA